MDQHLVISAIGRDRTGIVNSLSKAILDAGANIADSRMAVLGGEFAIILLVSGGTEAMRRLAEHLPAQGESLGLHIHTKPTEARAAADEGRPCRIEVIAMDHPGIVHDITDFFARRGINIERLDTTAYAAAHTGAPMFALHMHVTLAADTPVEPLRAGFLAFCDDLNLDATLEIGE